MTKLNLGEKREVERLCNPNKLRPAPGQDVDTPLPSIVADSYVKLYDSDDHFSGEDPSLEDIMRACEVNGFLPDRSYTNILSFGRLVIETANHHDRLFKEGLEEALQDPDLKKVMVHINDAADAQRRVQ